MHLEYKSNIQLNQKESLANVKGIMHYYHNGPSTNQLTFYLHKDFKIQSFVGEALARYEMDREGKPLWFLMCSRPVTVTLNRMITPGETITFEYAYEGVLAFDGFPIGEISEKQVELGFYAPWFLTHELMKPCHFDITVESDDPDCVWVGGRGFFPTAGKGHLKTVEPTLDGYMIGSALFSNQVVTVKEEAFETAVYYVKAEDRPLAEFLAASMKGLYSQMSKWFGTSDHSKMTIVIVDRNDGGGYNRPGLIVLDREGIHFETDDAVEKMFKYYYSYLAHEAGHLWWYRAEVLSWEDWLNESFAEFSSYLAIEAVYGKGESEKKLARYLEAKAKMPPIVGLDRGSDQAFSTLYLKGPALLHSWMERIGRDAFLTFLKSLYQARINSTDDFLKACEVSFGKSFADQVSSDLNN